MSVSRIDVNLTFDWNEYKAEGSIPNKLCLKAWTIGFDSLNAFSILVDLM